MFQDIQSSPSWTAIAFGILASFLGGGTAFKIFSKFLDRNKLPAEIDLTEAGAERARAEARKLHAEADIQTSERIERLLTRIDSMMADIDELRGERDSCKLRADLQAIELDLRDKQVKRMKGIMDAKGIKMSDFDENGNTSHA